MYCFHFSAGKCTVFTFQPGNVLFSLFSPEVLQAGAVKGLRQSLNKQVPAACSPFNRGATVCLSTQRALTYLSVCQFTGWVKDQLYQRI